MRSIHSREQFLSWMGVRINYSFVCLTPSLVSFPDGQVVN
jgi:hypothetical protein